MLCNHCQCSGKLTVSCYPLMPFLAALQHVKPHGINDKAFGSGSMRMLSIGIFLSLHFSVEGKFLGKV